MNVAILILFPLHMLGIGSLVDTRGCSNLKQAEQSNASKQRNMLITNLNVAVGKNWQYYFAAMYDNMASEHFSLCLCDIDEEHPVRSKGRNWLWPPQHSNSNRVTNPACSFKRDQKFGLVCTFLKPWQYESYADNFPVVQMQRSTGSLQCPCLFHQLIKLQQR